MYDLPDIDADEPVLVTVPVLAELDDEDALDEATDKTWPG